MTSKRAQSAIESPSAIARGLHGQSAMEFLMTYGWAVMIMLVVVAVLFMLGVFNPQTASPNACMLEAGMSCFGYALRDGGVLSLDLGQATGDDIVITRIACSAKETGPFSNVSMNVPVQSGRHKNITSLPRCEKADGTYPATGEFYRGNLIITYMDERTGIPYKVTGDLSYHVEGTPGVVSTPTPGGSETPTPTPGASPTPTEIAVFSDYFWALTVGESYAYVMVNNCSGGSYIDKVPVDGGSPTTLYSTSSTGFQEMSQDASSLYLSTWDSLLYQEGKGGGSHTVLASDSVRGVPASDGSNVYFINVSDGNLYSVPVGGGSITHISSGEDDLSNGYGVVVDSTYVYVAERGGEGRVIRVAKSGSGDTLVLASGISDANSLAQDGENVYTVEYDPGGRLMKIAKDGGGATELASGLNRPYMLVVDNGYAYFGECTNPGSVESVSTSGGTPQVLMYGLAWPCYVGTDADFVYAAENNDCGESNGLWKIPKGYAAPPPTPTPVPTLPPCAEGYEVSSCPCELNLPGSYTLAPEIPQTSNTCISITADDVSLDCHGNSLSGTGGGDGILLDGVSGATVTNCAVDGFNNGIHLSVATHNNIEGNNATNCGYTGILADISDTNTITDNGAHQNSYYGLYFSSSNSNNVSGNSVTDNDLDFYCVSADGNNDLGSNECDYQVGCGDWLYSCPPATPTPSPTPVPTPTPNCAGSCTGGVCDGCGGTISSSGTWNINSDINCAGCIYITAGVVIDANSVTLDCHHHTLTGPGTSNYIHGVNIANGRHDNTVENCDVTNWWIGIVGWNANNNHYVNNTANGNMNGFWLVGGSGNTFATNTVCSTAGERWHCDGGQTDSGGNVCLPYPGTVCGDPGSVTCNSGCPL